MSYLERQRTHPGVTLAAIQQCAEMVSRGGGLAAVIRFIFPQLPTLLGLFLPSFRCVVGERKQGETLTRIKGGDVGKRFHSGAYPLPRSGQLQNS